MQRADAQPQPGVRQTTASPFVVWDTPDEPVSVPQFHGQTIDIKVEDTTTVSEHSHIAYIILWIYIMAYHAGSWFVAAWAPWAVG